MTWASCPTGRRSLRRRSRRAAGAHDLVVTSGGVSVGEEDHVKQAVERLGHLHLWRLAIKPGRPIALGQLGQVPFVGLPGNPVAVVVTFLNLVRPMILRLMGGQSSPPLLFRVSAGFDHKKKKDRREWVRARLEPDAGGGWRALKFPREGAGILSSLVDSDGLVELPEGDDPPGGGRPGRLPAVQRGHLMKLLYFAWIRTKTGIAEEEITPPDSVTTVGELLDWLKDRGPGYAAALADLGVVRVAVNQNYADHTAPVGPNDEVALFPPVTGG